MSQYYSKLLATVEQHMSELIEKVSVEFHELTIVVSPLNLINVCKKLRDDKHFGCEILLDVCGVDYSTYENKEWPNERFAVVYHLLSIKNNHRIRLKVFVDGEPPIVDSVIEIWNTADWFEREAFDLFGIVFEGHPDLRRILTDYGFVGHPFRKDFPLSGNVEMRYDPEKKRVIYEPVTIEPRISHPRIIRDDNRYVSEKEEGQPDA